ncbi:MAG: LLM class flavin-dependent oxidoreductase [Acidimicrobiia bacterium]
MRPMRFEIFMQPIHPPDENPTYALERDLDLIEHLDTFGYDAVWIGEHHTTGWETISSPAVFIAAAAARTSRIKLGSGIVPLSIHHPFMVANDYVLLDHLTRGRAMLGVGPGGGLPSDSYAFGLDRETQNRRYLERFDAMMQLFETEEPFTVEGEGFVMHEGVLQLRPFTYPRMPIAIVTGSNPESLARIGRHGLRWLAGTSADRFDASWEQIETAAASVGRSADRHDATLAVHMHIAPTREEAIEQVRDGTARERFEFSSPIGAQPLPDMDRSDWVEHFAAMPNVCIGSPEDAVSFLSNIREVTGAGGVLISSKEWAGPQGARDSFELIARYVMPHMQGSLVGLKAAEAVATKTAPLVS